MDYTVNPFINYYSLKLYDSGGSPSLSIFFFILIGLLVFATLLLFKKKFYVEFYIILFTLLFVISTTAFFYNRGLRLSEVRNNGFLLLGYVENFKKINDRYPFNIDETYEFILERNKGDLEKIKRTRNSYENSFITPKGKEDFGLIIKDDLLGFDYFLYKKNPPRFELVSGGSSD